MREYSHTDSNAYEKIFDVKNKISLKKGEMINLSKRLLELVEYPIIETFNLITYRDINKHLFDKYSWAGKTKESENLKEKEKNMENTIAEIKSEDWKKFNLQNKNDLHVVSFKIHKAIAGLYKNEFCNDGNLITSAAFVITYLEKEGIPFDAGTLVKNYNRLKNEVAFFTSMYDTLENPEDYYEYFDDIIKESIQKGIERQSDKALGIKEVSYRSLGDYVKLIEREKAKAKANIEEYSVEEYFEPDRVLIEKDSHQMFEPIEGLKYESFEDFCKLHEHLFNGQKWAGQLRTKELKIAEPAFKGKSILYESPDKIKEKAAEIIDKFNNKDLKNINLHSRVYAIYKFLSGMYKLQPCKGTIATSLAFLKNNLENKGVHLEMKYFTRDFDKLRDSFANASAYFKKGMDFRQELGLYNIVEDSVLARASSEEHRQYRADSRFSPKSDIANKDFYRRNQKFGHDRDRKTMVEIG